MKRETRKHRIRIPSAPLFAEFDTLEVCQTARPRTPGKLESVPQ